jgi:hypothetical protein
MREFLEMLKTPLPSWLFLLFVALDAIWKAKTDSQINLLERSK